MTSSARSRPKVGRTWAPVLAGLCLLVACKANTKSDEALPPAVPTSPTPSGPVSPLTGLPIEPALAGRPTLVVKIDNAPKARPQAGLVEADVVVEEEVEGGITRFAALFHSRDAANVGPVRSARSTDILITSALNRPLFAYSGANLAFQHLIARSPLIDAGVDRFPQEYRRESRRPSPYNQFSSTPGLFSHVPPGAGPPPPLFAFRQAGQAVDAAGAAPVTGVDVEFRGVVVIGVQYRWDAASGTWRRSQDGGPHVDVGGVQVAPRNVVVQLANYRNTAFKDQSGAPVPEAELVGEGEAWVLTDGKMVRGRWRKTAPGAVTEYLDPSGAPIRLTPGPTWIELARPGKAAVAP
ncbi:MAG: DUF3048 domain-containing protein [Actinomycetota bacterium]|nr:DUF3048 domain-containing protein [Actinomycetota bacterium]